MNQLNAVATTDEIIPASELDTVRELSFAELALVGGGADPINTY